MEKLSFLSENYFDHTGVRNYRETPLPDEPFVVDWEEYIEDIPREGPLAALQKRLMQLKFPVKEGMSQNSNYRLATRSGADTFIMPEATGVELQEPDKLEIYLYRTFAGRIPVIMVRNRNDFETLVRVFSHRNEPVPVPASMGACMIKGCNNWDRVKKYKEKWKRDNGYKETPDFLWGMEFEKMKSQRELYQDTFLILTDTEYSNVSAGMLGMDRDEWRRLSLVIRREHEATHYCTLRLLRSARNHLLDELIADYTGIVAAAGSYRANWFLCFMGLENYPAFRPGGRLVNYLNERQLSETAFENIKFYVRKAALNLEIISEKYAPAINTGEGKHNMFLTVTKMNLMELASEDCEKKLLENGLKAFCREEVRKN